MIRSSALLFGTVFIISCASAYGVETGQESTTSDFLGCTPSSEECTASCPDQRSSTFVGADPRCPAKGGQPNETGACFCVRDE